MPSPPPGVGVFATSDAVIGNEGIEMREISTWAERSRAREVIAILDCCHAGSIVNAVTKEVLSEAEQGFSSRPGRAVLAACSAHQQGWEALSDEQKVLGAFSSHIIGGLRGAARLRHGTNVRASVLGAHVTDVFRSWQQSPITHNSETGDRHCIITSGFDAEKPPKRSIAKTALDTLRPKAQITTLYIGVPFKPSTTFVGRSAELDFLRSMLLDGSKPIAVSATVEGLGGIGKTELVLQLLNDQQIASAFATIVWLDAAGPLFPQWEETARKLEIRRVSKEPHTLLKQIASKLRERGNALFILDNASQWEPVRTQIPDGFPLLVTTRTHDFGGPSFHHTELGVLSDDAAADFFEKLVPAISVNPALPRLIRALEGHALAIELAAHYIRDFCSPEEYLNRLSTLQKEMPEGLVAKTHYNQTVDSCLRITWDTLKSDSARLLWRKASLFAPTSAHRDLLRVSFVCGGSDSSASDIAREIAFEEYRSRRWQQEERSSNPYPEFDPNALAGIGKAEDFDAAYAELRDCHVLARVEGFNGERWAMHRLVRDFARPRLQEHEISIHAISLADWLRDPTLPITLEIPHFVAAILDVARVGRPFQGRRVEREIGFRGGGLFESGYMLQFIREELNDPKALTLILSGLSDINPDVRVASVELLENVGPIPEVLEGLAHALDDADPKVRETAGQTLAQHGGERTLAILSETLASPNARARITAIRALTLMGAKAWPALRAGLQNDIEDVRMEAALSLSEQGQSDGIATLTSAVGRNAIERKRLAFALASANDERAVEPLCGLLRDRNQSWSVRRTAATHLGKLKSVRAVSALTRALNDHDNDVREAAIKALAEIGDRSPLATLEIVAAKDKYENVKKAAAAAIQKLRGGK
jgi:HEAT repeat protein